jgi:inorganic pyrophosphatase
VKRANRISPDELPPFNDKGELCVVVETSQGSPNKLKWDPELGRFRLSGVLPAGAVFPYDFGFVPGTQGEDGDPLDVLLLMDAPVPAGALVEARLIGVIEAEQTEDGETVRNDRLLAVATASHTHRSVRELTDLDRHLLEQIEHFFASYNQIKGKEFRPLARRGAAAACRMVHSASVAEKAAT